MVGEKKDITILVVDDDRTALEMVRAFCKDMPYGLEFATNGREALDFLRSKPVNLVVTDVRMPEMDGEDLLSAIKKENPQIPVIVMTSYGSIDGAVHFIKAGANDYINKPLTKEDFLHRLNQVIGSLRMSEEIAELRSKLQRAERKVELIGNSTAMRRVMEQVYSIAQTDASVVIYGESGTGKELVAKTIHQFSRRADMPFVPVNCGALPETLLESELFGYKRGAFTDATTDYPGLVVEANKGTLFLDEVGEMSPKVQVKLLRFLQDKEVRPLGSTKSVKADVRIVAATNRDLKAAIQQGEFREDLFYRLNIVPISIPPLRERKEDIPLLANYFLRKFAKEFGKDVKEISPLALQRLVGYNWPGNVRELENKIQQVVVMAHSSVIRPEDIDAPSHLASFKEEKRKIVTEFEVSYISKMLALHGGNISRAAKAAGMDRKNFWQLMKKHGIDPSEVTADSLPPG